MFFISRHPKYPNPSPQCPFCETSALFSHWNNGQQYQVLQMRLMTTVVYRTILSDFDPILPHNPLLTPAPPSLCPCSEQILAASECCNQCLDIRCVCVRCDVPGPLRPLPQAAQEAQPFWSDRGLEPQLQMTMTSQSRAPWDTPQNWHWAALSNKFSHLNLY